MDMAKPIIRFKGYQDDWEQRKLGEHCEMYNGDRSSKYPNAQDMVAEGIPFINAGDLENGRVNLTECNKISREKYDDLGGAKLQLGDIVYCLRGTLGKNAYIDNFTEGTVASSLVAIRPKNIDGRFMFHVLNSDIEYRQRMVHDEGAAQPNLSAKSVSEFIMPVPHIDEQKKISAYFDNLDHLITLHQRKCDETKKLKKYMLQKMFPQNGEKVPEIRFSGFTDDWEQRKLGDVAQEFKSGTSLKADEIDITGDYPVYGGNGLRGYTSTYNHDGEYALIGRQGALCGNMNYSVGKAYFTEHAVVVKADENNDTMFLYYMLDTMNLGQYSDQSAQPGLAVNKLVKLENWFPTKEEQQRIGWYFSNLDHLITLHQRELENLQNIKKFMLEKMFV